MKKSLLIIAAVVGMVGCSTKPEVTEVGGTAYRMHVPIAKPPVTVYTLNGYDGPTAMDSNEVLDASRECVMTKMRPRVSYVTITSDAGKVRVPVSVMCEPF